MAFVGRFVPKKGIDVLLAAWPLVRRSIPSAELTLLGYGDAAPVANADLSIAVWPPDSAYPRDQVRDLIRWCRVYVSPSRTGPDGDSESQHIGNLEAQAAGRVVLTTDHGPIPEFVDDMVSGMVVPQGDRLALADALITLLTNPPRSEQLAGHATVAARRFHVDHNSHAHEVMYAEVLGGGLRDRSGRRGGQ